MTVRVLAFARLAELLRWSSREIQLPENATGDDLWNALARQTPAIAPLAESTRLARNGRIVMRAEPLSAGDELALLPPSGGG